MNEITLSSLCGKNLNNINIAFDGERIVSVDKNINENRQVNGWYSDFDIGVINKKNC